MKKFLALAFIAISIIIPCKVYALDITVGINTWYAWVKQDYYNEPTEYLGYYGDSYPYPYSYSPMKSDPGLLYGPAISVKFNDDFNLTFVYLYGQFDYKGKEYFYIPGDFVEVEETKINFKSKRSDADLALNYRLNDYFKVFGGIKYLSFDMMDAKYEYYYPNLYYSGEEDQYIPYTMKNHGKHRSIGPGLGFSLTYPIINNLFLLSNLSGFYLFDIGSEKVGLYDKKESDFGSDLIDVKIGSFKASYREYGFNATISLAYYIESISTSISLGGRWQYFITDYQDEIYDVSIKNSIYGITLAATYSFSFDAAKTFRTSPKEEMLPILQDEPNMPTEKIGPRELIEQYRQPGTNEEDIPNEPRQGGQSGEMLMPVD